MVARQGRIRRETRLATGVHLGWPGRQWEPAPAAEGVAAAPSAITIETAGGGAAASSAPIRLVHGDALDVAHTLAGEGLAGHVDIAYLDPPFASQSAYTCEARLDGRADGRVVRSHAYDDRWEKEGIGAYLDMLAPRLEATSRLLAPSGTIWVHVDYRASYFVRLLLDEIMGPAAFVNEIVWRRAPNLGRQAASYQFGRTLDTIVVYGGARAALIPPTRLEPIEAKAVRRDVQGRPFIAAPRGDYTDESIRRLDLEGRVHRTSTGKVYVKYFLVPDAEGALCRERRVDALWTDVPPLRHSRPGERTGFPTQKPRALLDRIIACASSPNGLVVDFFAGSATTAESAYALGRRCVTSDVSPVAIATARARLLRAGAPLIVQRCGPAKRPAAACPEVTATRKPDGVHVELLAPREPLAWAIDVAQTDSAPFCTAWHSERTPGGKACPVVREASLQDAPGPIAVAVWNDDGSVGTCVVEAR